MGIPEMAESRARETGLSNQPLLSLAMREGNPDGNLMRLAWESSSWFEWRLVFWIREEEEEEKWAECWSLRETQVSKRKTERRKGKAWGFFRKCTIDDEYENVFPCIELSEVWLFEYEFLLGFAIIHFIFTVFVREYMDPIFVRPFVWLMSSSFPVFI